MSFRKAVLLLHLTAGLLGAVFLILLGGSGAILVFENELNHALNRKLYCVEPGAARLSLNAIRDRLVRLHPGSAVTNFTLPESPRLAVIATLRISPQGKTRTVSVNPYSGEELGSLEEANSFTRQVHQFHTNLLLGPPGKRVTSAAAFFLLGLSITGIVLWWPFQRWRWRPFRRSRPGAWELHTVLGFYSSVFMLLFALTGVVIHWDDEVRSLINRMARAEDVPVPAKGPGGESVSAQSPDELLQAALSAAPGARVTSIQGIGGKSPVRITMKYPEDATPAGRTNLYLDPSSGAVLSGQTSRTAPLGTRIVKLWNRELHTGDIAGWPTRILAFVGSLCLPILAVTGPLIWWGRLRKKQAAGS